jgi:FAD/FMN-containing dehydrogenase/Fe-S oxidoreductase
MLDFSHQIQHALHEHLHRHLEGEVRFDEVSRKLYSTDASIYQIAPVGVVIPKTEQDLVTAVQIALEMHVPIIARGGGTSLSGQSIGPGLVVDCSKYLNRIVEIDADRRIARVQPGVILDTFNRALAPHGLQFGPDVATASRANLGGMIGNNSAGSHSIVHGKTLDHVRNLRVLLTDGKIAEFGPVSRADWLQREDASFVGGLYRQVRSVTQANAQEIQKRFPRILRRVSGYNLDGFADAFTADSPKPVGLHQLLVGSEGTLGVTLEAELNLVEKPKAVGLLIPQFDDFAATMDALALCLEMKPSAVELMDRLLLDLAANNLSLRGTMAVVSRATQALFMVEFTGDSEREVGDRIDTLDRKLQGTPGLIATVKAIDAAQRGPLWNLRNAAVPLLLGLPGDKKPATFIEDTAVAPEHLPRFVKRFRAILHAHGTDGSFYGHASVGCLHIRPVLNLKDHRDLARMRRIMHDISDLVLEFGGSLSGEHGDGLARSEWNRKMFGDTVYDAFCQVKRAFDPNQLLNPGKIVHAPPMTENLRYGPDYQPVEPPTLFDYSKQEGFARSIELCNGAGVCRKLQGGTMCPSFRATLDEKDSTRGRANALRLAMSGDEPLKELASPWVHDVLDLCLMCKACKSECPSNVDLAKLKAEVLNLHHQSHPRPLLHRVLAQLPMLNEWGAFAAPVTNRIQANRVVRWLLHHFVGIDCRRSLPELHADHFRRWFARHQRERRRRTPTERTPPLGVVLLLDDCFTTFNEPAIGKAAVHVLETAGYHVQRAGLTCCGRMLLSKGMLPEAKRLVQEQAPRLARQLAVGLPILGLEPSCLVTLIDEWPDLVPGPATKLIAQSAHLADGWLAQQVKSGRCTLPLAPLSRPGEAVAGEGLSHVDNQNACVAAPSSCVVHGHCHQKALVGVQGTADLLRLVPGLDVRVLDTGCCGMAGSFGFEKEHYDLSVAIARNDLLPALAAHPEAAIAAPGTSCRHQIRDLTPRRALHPLEIVATYLGES